MVGWHHWLNGHGFGWTLRVGDGQGGLACCSLWGRKELDTTQRLKWTELKHLLISGFNPLCWNSKRIKEGSESVSSSVMSNSLQSHGLSHQAPLPMRFSKQEYWRGLPRSSPGDLPNPGIESRSLASQADSLPLSHQGSQKGRRACPNSYIIKSDIKMHFMLVHAWPIKTIRSCTDMKISKKHTQSLSSVQSLRPKSKLSIPSKSYVRLDSNSNDTKIAWNISNISFVPFGL